jgi:DNA-directed RNA polymerase subunit RPC12/RpoP
MNKWIPVPKEKCELEGPYQCSNCGGHVMLDATFLDQVDTKVGCPYCVQLAEAPKEEDL